MNFRSAMELASKFNFVAFEDKKKVLSSSAAAAASWSSRNFLIYSRDGKCCEEIQQIYEQHIFQSNIYE